MDLHIDVALQGDLLLVTASGSLVFDVALRLLKEVCDIAAEKQVDRILVDCLAVDGEVSTLDRYSLGAEVAAYLRQREVKPKLAIVGKPPTIDGFGVRVGQNRGITTEVFSSQQAALKWLDRWPPNSK